MIDNNPFNHLAQQFFSLLLLKPIIQRSNFGGNLQGCIQIIDMEGAMLIKRIQRLPKLPAPILPLCPQVVPHGFRDLARYQQAHSSRLFIVDTLERCLKLFLFIWAQIAELLRKFVRIGAPNQRHEVRVDLDAHHLLTDLRINFTAQKTDLSSA